MPTDDVLEQVHEPLSLVVLQMAEKFAVVIVGRLGQAGDESLPRRRKFDGLITPIVVGSLK